MVKYDKRGVPFSTATNAYDFINDSIQVMKEEPRRVDMGDWKQPKWHVQDMADENMAPACGTVCCWGGWNATLARKTSFPYMGETSTRILIGPRPEYNYSEEGKAAYEWDDLNEDLNTIYGTYPPRGLQTGTYKYVMYVVKEIRAFQIKHKARLKAQKVIPPRIAKARQRQAKARPRQSPAKARAVSRS